MGKNESMNREGGMEEVNITKKWVFMTHYKLLYIQNLLFTKFALREHRSRTRSPCIYREQVTTGTHAQPWACAKFSASWERPHTDKGENTPHVSIFSVWIPYVLSICVHVCASIHVARDGPLRRGDLDRRKDVTDITWPSAFLVLAKPFLRVIVLSVFWALGSHTLRPT